MKSASCLANAGCEAFITTVQGKTLAHVLCLCLSRVNRARHGAGSRQTILAHLDHYLVCEQVTLVDRTEEWSEILLYRAPRRSDAGRAERGTAAGELPGSQAPNSTGGKVWLRRADLAGPHGILISGPDADVAAVRAKLLQTGAVECELQAFEAARVEWGFPLFARDISEQNLPQEIARDAQAISFVKGCYLGQETVARIDALGHVNKLLVGVRFLGHDRAGRRQELLTAEGKSWPSHVGRLLATAGSRDLDWPMCAAAAMCRQHARLRRRSGEAEIRQLAPAFGLSHARRSGDLDPPDEFVDPTSTRETRSALAGTWPAIEKFRLASASCNDSSSLAALRARNCCVSAESSTWPDSIDRMAVGPLALQARPGAPVRP